MGNKEKAKKIFEQLKKIDNRGYFDKDKQNGEDTLKINSTEDIIYFIYLIIGD